MLLLRDPTADKHSGRVSFPRTLSCLVKRSSHRLAFTPELGVKRPRCYRRLPVPAGNARQHPRVPPPAGAPGSAAPSAGRARCASFLGGYSRAGKEYLHPCKSAARRRRGAGARLVAGARYLSRAALGSGVPGFCFIRLSVGFGKGTQSFPIARCHMENLQYFDYGLCKHSNIGSLKSRDYPKGD